MPAGIGTAPVMPADSRAARQAAVSGDSPFVFMSVLVDHLGMRVVPSFQDPDNLAAPDNSEHEKDCVEEGSEGQEHGRGLHRRRRAGSLPRGCTGFQRPFRVARRGDCALHGGPLDPSTDLLDGARERGHGLPDLLGTKAIGSGGEFGHLRDAARIARVVTPDPASVNHAPGPTARRCVALSMNTAVPMTASAVNTAGSPRHHQGRKVRTRRHIADPIGGRARHKGPRAPISRAIVGVNVQRGRRPTSLHG